MRIVIFCHSLRSCWNHGNAHFLRGVTRELLQRGHHVNVFEPADAWSVQNLVKDHGPDATRLYQRQYPMLESTTYESVTSVYPELEQADLVLVHEWNDPQVVKELGQLRLRWNSFTLLFHDTHHRAVSAPEEMERFDLEHYDGALVFGRVLAEIYREKQWVRRVFVWHEAADTFLFHPAADASGLPVGDTSDMPAGDVVWVGNFGDEERTSELKTFLLEPCAPLKAKANVWGVRYPPATLQELELHGIEYHGWLPNTRVPAVFASHRVSPHVPRRPYTQMLPGIPTIRPFETMACGIPMVSSPWEDAEGLFTPGADFLMVRSAEEMKDALHAVLTEEDLAASLRQHGLATIRSRHTCAHRVDELLGFLPQLRAPSDEEQLARNGLGQSQTRQNAR